MTHHPREPSLRASHTSAIAFRGVRKRFEGRAVLSDLSLEVRAGEIFAIVGTNGAGKTTCIRCLLDLCHVDDGRIDIFGRPASAPESRRPLAYLPERFLPPRDLLGREFLDFMARMHGVEPSSDRRQAVSSALDLAPSALDRPVREYSKGMARKLGLAGCFLSGKSLFVLDEPMSGLDPKARLLARRCLAERRAGGATVFFSTHLLGDAGDMCDRLAVVHDGAVRFAGSPARFRERYPAPTLEESWLACISSEAAPQTDKACSAPLPDASLQGTSYPSQPRTSTRETTFGNLAHRPRGLRAAPLVEIDAAQGF